MATLYNSYFKKGQVKAQRRISRSGQEGRDGGGVGGGWLKCLSTTCRTESYNKNIMVSINSALLNRKKIYISIINSKI